MKIKWIAVKSNRVNDFTQPETDVLKMDGEEYDFSDASFIEYDTTGTDIVSAKRIDGVLHLAIIRRFTEGNKNELPWNTGDYIDYGTEVVLCAE